MKLSSLLPLMALLASPPPTMDITGAVKASDAAKKEQALRGTPAVRNATADRHLVITVPERAVMKPIAVTPPGKAVTCKCRPR